MPYLNCPSCRLTISDTGRSAAPRNCPRCRARFGRVRPLFASPLPYRLLAAPTATESTVFVREAKEAS